MYRQFLELYIKDILLRFDEGFDSKKKPYNDHDLCKLWRRLLEIVRQNLIYFPVEIDGEDLADILAATDSYITELAVADRNSFSFRYPDNKDHTMNYFPHEMPIDLINLRERIGELANVLFLIERTFTNIQMLEEDLASSIC